METAYLQLAFDIVRILLAQVFFEVVECHHPSICRVWTRCQVGCCVIHHLAHTLEIITVVGLQE